MSRLTSITISDFRSIRGTITVPLDAPIVLVHGSNGAGKTSMLSALELALTGHIPSFQRADPEYLSHLVHKQAEESRILLTASAAPADRLSSEISITRKVVQGVPLLGQNAAHFYSERCFLAQATLGRLLEIYQDKDTRKSVSPLTRFVNDLLGLDQLDALIDGLHDAGDVRRFRSTVPAYWETRENIPSLEKDRQRILEDLVKLKQRQSESLEALQAQLVVLSLESLNGTDVSVLIAELTGSPEEVELQRLSAMQRQALAAQEQWQEIRQFDSGEDQSAAEARSASANSALRVWEAGAGAELDRVYREVSRLLPAIKAQTESGPASSYARLVEAVGLELEMVGRLLNSSKNDELRMLALQEELERAEARKQILAEQLSGFSDEGGPLARALSAISLHVHSDNCPACQRDFSEVSATPLLSFIQAQIESLSESAAQLEELSRQQAETSSVIAIAERERQALVDRSLESRLRDEAKSREAGLRELRQALGDLSADVQVGQRLFVEAQDAARALATLRSRDIQGSSVRQLVGQLGESLGAPPLESTESPEAALERFISHINEREASLELQRGARRNAVDLARDVFELRKKMKLLEDEATSLGKELGRLRSLKEGADEIISEARDLAHRARETRTSIVRRVFNDSLNSIWRDLFVRLAPEEPFVPAFALPHNAAGAVEAVLETRYRAGGNGGNPRSMLSAGNLNTAALTLFLSLHLSVAPLLPWLVIDDPVQSMDEVHIAQFAALLRTLSKVHDRQIIIAVHEKPLFDYLSLELSPAFKSDRLITVELERDADGETTVKYTPIIWEPDTAIAA